MRRSLGVAGLVACIGIALASCGSPAVPSGPANPASTPPTTGASAGNAGPLGPSPTGAPTVALGSPTVGPNGLAIDPGLLSVLPGALGELNVAESPDVESAVLGDHELPKHADGYAGAVVGDLGGSDWATASVVRLNPASQTDAYYAAWRTDYDRAACDQAGGIASEETIQAAGRDVDHVTCQGGVDLYHVFLRDRGELVSITSIGPLQLGLQLVQALRA